MSRYDWWLEGVCDYCDADDCVGCPYIEISQEQRLAELEGKDPIIFSEDLDI